jgi:hypothetical protein
MYFNKHHLLTKMCFRGDMGRKGEVDRARFIKTSRTKTMSINTEKGTGTLIRPDDILLQRILSKVFENGKY